MWLSSLSWLKDSQLHVRRSHWRFYNDLNYRLCFTPIQRWSFAGWRQAVGDPGTQTGNLSRLTMQMSGLWWMVFHNMDDAMLWSVGWPLPGHSEDTHCYVHPNVTFTHSQVENTTSPLTRNGPHDTRPILTVQFKVVCDREKAFDVVNPPVFRLTITARYILWIMSSILDPTHKLISKGLYWIQPPLDVAWQDRNQF